LRGLRQPGAAADPAGNVAAVARDAPDPAALARVIGRFVEGPVEVGGLRRYSGGASRETWAVDATDGRGQVHELVLRRDPAAQVSAANRATEYALLAAADAGGVPVPKVRALLTDDDGLGAGFLMDRVDGETIPRRILRDAEFEPARAHLAAQAGTIAARIHAVDPGGLPRLPTLGAREQIEQQRALLDAFDEPHPALELGLRWLDRHAVVDDAAPSLVHGDFRNGNFIVGRDGIRAVLDWELAHFGDPIEDLGWLCVKSWRFGNADLVAGGFGALDELLAAYTGAGGAPVDRETVRFWVVLGTVKWGVICAGQALAFLNGILRNVEMAALGRRVAEMEWDLLDLLDGGW
jgi:aminoglycoside phosphotransferase (APT) family kinase protein